MKRTDFERQQRDLKKSQKKEMLLVKKSQSGSGNRSIAEYINDLFALFRYDAEEIFNLNNDDKILELLEEMKIDLPEKQWDNVIRKGIKKTKINQKEKAFNELKDLIS